MKRRWSFYSLRKIAKSKPRLKRIPRMPPMNAEKPLVIQPQRPIGGGPRMIVGKHQENQRNRNRTKIPRRTKMIEIIRDFPPLK